MHLYRWLAAFSTTTLLAAFAGCSGDEPPPGGGGGDTGSTTSTSGGAAGPGGSGGAGGAAVGGGGAGGGAGGGGSGSGGGGGSGSGSGGGGGSGSGSGGGGGSGNGSGSGGGAGSGGSGGAGGGSAGGTVEVVVDTPQPWILALDPGTDEIYWTRRSTGMSGAVFHVKKTGVGYGLLYDNENDPRGIFADAGGLYWVTLDGLRTGAKNGSGASTLWHAPQPGTPAWDALMGPLCFMGQLSAVTADATHVYWTQWGDLTCPGVFRLPKAPGGQVDAFASSMDPGAGIAIDATHIFFTRGPRRMAKDGTGLIPIGNLDALEGIALDATHAYVQADTMLYRVAKDGSNPTVLATWAGCGTYHYPFNVAIDATHVYWLEQCSNTVRRVAKAGGAEEVLHSGATCLMSIVADGQAVYWSECDDMGKIMKWVKP